MPVPVTSSSGTIPSAPPDPSGCSCGDSALALPIHLLDTSLCFLVSIPVVVMSIVVPQFKYSCRRQEVRFMGKTQPKLVVYFSLCEDRPRIVGVCVLVEEKVFERDGASTAVVAEDVGKADEGCYGC